MTAGIKRKKLLPEKECWKEWMRLGSLLEVALFFEKRGLINPDTGQKFTGSGIEKAAFRWILENQDEAYADLKFAWERVKVMDSDGNLVSKILTNEDWRQYLASKARLTYYATPIKLQKFLANNGLA